MARGVACQVRENEARVTTMERTPGRATFSPAGEILRYGSPRRGYHRGHVAVLLRPLSVAICHSDVCKHARSRLASRYVRSNHARRRKTHSSSWQGLPREILDQTTRRGVTRPISGPLSLAERVIKMSLNTRDDK